MNKEHKEIINLISEYLSNNHSIRFGQALFNLDVNQFQNGMNPDKGMRDIHGDKDDEIIKRIKTRLNRFKNNN